MTERIPFPGPSPIDINRVASSTTFATRVLYFLQLWTFKIVARAFILFTQYIYRLPRAQRATYTKLYPSSPEVHAHVFIPKTYKSGDRPLPLLIDVHGGGFCLGNPILDSADNARFANTHGFVVVSVGYRFGPTYPFPAAVDDVALQIKDILRDKDLPVDLNRVAVIGYSAGGNLALTAVQLHGLHDQIKASVAFYPAVDFVVTSTEREKKRIPHPDGRTDLLAKGVFYFNWGYVPVGTELKHPLLSPRFAEREKLPKSLYILGCEYDVLCHSAWTMAEELAEKSGIPKNEDNRDGDDGWESGNVRWKHVRGVEHGFNTFVDQKRGADKALYVRKRDECQADVAEWLHRVAFAKE